MTAPIERADDGRRKLLFEDRKVCKRHHFIVPTMIKNDPRYAEEIRKVFSESKISSLCHSWSAPQHGAATMNSPEIDFWRVSSERYFSKTEPPNECPTRIDLSFNKARLSSS